MSQQMNEVLNSDTIRGSTDQNATFMFQSAEFRSPSKDGLFPCAQMASEDSKTQESADSKTSVSVKLEVRDSIEDEGSSNSRPPQCLSKESLCDADIKSPADDVGEDSCKSHTSDEKRDDKSDAGLDVNSEGEQKEEVDSEASTPIIKEELSPVEPVIVEKRKGRPRGRKSANASLRNYGADSPGDREFDSPNAGTPKGMFPTEKRKRGRPRGSRGSRGANTSIELRSFSESPGILTDVGSPEVTGDFPKYEHTPPIIKIGRGALRPGCKSYRGRAACMGRGYKVEYSESPSWGAETAMTPVEYDSALSPLTDVDLLDRRRYSVDACTPPLPKRARGTRKRGRGRSRGRARVSLDRSMDSDSSDFGVSRFDTPDYSTRGCDTPELMDPNTESEVDACDSVEKVVHKRRGRGRGSRGGGRVSVEAAAADSDVALETTVTCAVCKETMTQQLFGYHKLRKHNNCSWREGIDTPLDLNDSKVVNALLKVALQKKKQLTCEQCGISRSSLAGYQSHLTFCAKTEGERDALLETCPVCKRRMMPSSLKVHMGVHRQEEKARELEKLQGTPEREDPGEGSSKNSGKSKRAAANRYALPYYFYDSDGSDTL